MRNIQKHNGFGCYIRNHGKGVRRMYATMVAWLDWTVTS